jgi:hypothetical protein
MKLQNALPVNQKPNKYNYYSPPQIEWSIILTRWTGKQVGQADNDEVTDNNYL